MHTVVQTIPYLLAEFLVSGADHVYDPRVHVDDDDQGEVEGADGRVDDVAHVLVVGADLVLVATVVL